MKRFNPILKKALTSTKGFGLNESGYLYGEDVIRPCDRWDFAMLFFNEFSGASDRFEGEGTNKIRVAPACCTANQFLELIKLDETPLSQGINLRYGMIKTDDDMGVRWDAPYKSEVRDNGYVIETIESAFIIYESDAKPCGFFSFNLSLERSKEFSAFAVHLPLVYVIPSYRKGVFAQDLTFSLAYFISDVFDKVFRLYRGKNKLDIIVDADFASKGGERLVSFIIDELECTRETLKETMPKKLNKLGILEREVGW